jgi:4-amino-4-deoxy-L-arabinose transferase-like glycosyltransferase
VRSLLRRSPRDWDQIAIAAVAVGAVLRVLWVLALHPPMDYVYSDMLGYLERATRAAFGAPLERFDAHSPPGGHLLLMLPLAFFGVDRSGLFAAAALWCALSAATPYFVWRFVRLLLTPAAAGLTAIFVALWPLHIAYAGYFLTETPSLALFTASLWLATSARRAHDMTKMALLGGLLAGAAVAIRPMFLLNAVLTIAPLARPLERYRRAAIPFVAGLMLVLLGVVAHNTAATGHLTGLSENTGMDFFLGHCNVNVLTTGRPDSLHFRFGSPAAVQRGGGRDYDFPDHQVWEQDFFVAQAFECIRADGVGHVRLVLRNIFDMGFTTVPWPPSNEAILRDVVRVNNVLYAAALPFLVIGGIRLLRKRRRVGDPPNEAYLLLHMTPVVVLAVVFFGDPRYRIPYDIFGLALLAAIIADRFLDPRSEARVDSAVDHHPSKRPLVPKGPPLHV